jgi:hypothetical protein
VRMGTGKVDGSAPIRKHAGDLSVMSVNSLAEEEV